MANIRGSRLMTAALVASAAFAMAAASAQTPSRVPLQPQQPPQLAPEAQNERSGPLQLADVLASVVEHYPLVRAARVDLAVAVSEQLVAQGAFDPELRGRAAAIPTGPYSYTRIETSVNQPLGPWGTNIFGGYRFGLGEVPPYYGEYVTNHGGELRAGVSVSLLRNRDIDRRRATVERASFAQKAAGFGVEQAQFESLRGAAQRYWDWVVAGRRLVIARELLEIARTRDEQLTRRVNMGDLPVFERTDNQRALTQRQSQVVAAERSLQQATIELSLFLRGADGAPILVDPARLPASFPEPGERTATLSGALGEAYARRPDLRRLEAQREQQRVDSRLAENQRAPLVDVSVSAAKDFGGPSERLGRPELELGLVVDVPTFNRAARGRSEAAEATIGRMDLQLQLQRERVAADVRDALSAIDAARQRVELARQELKLARELETGERRRFLQGDSSLLFINLREQTAAEAAVREQDALADFFKAVATLKAAMAVPAVQSWSAP